MSAPKPPSSKSTAARPVAAPAPHKSSHSGKARRVRKPSPIRPAYALPVAVVVSLVAHAVMLAIGFVGLPAGPKVNRDQGLQIVLVNAKHAQSSKNAKVLAQANLDGGGNTDQNTMPTSPLPPDPEQREGDSLVEAKKRQVELEAVQRDLLTAAKSKINAETVEKKKKSDENPTETDPSPPGIDMVRATAIARQAAIVEKSLKEYASRPRKAFVAPTTKYASHAQYVTAWSTKVARVGELNFPRNQIGSLYGSVQVHVELSAEGRLVTLEIVRPDKDPKINDAALRIIKIAEPYAPFPPEIRKEYDRLEFVRTLTFTRDDVTMQ